MAAKENLDCQEIVKCDVCGTPVSFYCRRCVVNLCDPCVLVHVRVKSEFGHDIMFFLVRMKMICVSVTRTQNITALHTVNHVTSLFACFAFLSNTGRMKSLNCPEILNCSNVL